MNEDLEILLEKTSTADAKPMPDTLKIGPLEMPTGADGFSRVRFSDDQMQEHDSSIVVKSQADNNLAVHLGFLQVFHQYEIQFSIKDNLSEDLTADPLQNLYAKVLDVMPTEDGEGHELIIEFNAHKEKLLRETLILVDKASPNKTLKLVLHARVLGKGKGTPSVKNGIRCIGINVDEDSEHSDWQGFD